MINLTNFLRQYYAEEDRKRRLREAREYQSTDSLIFPKQSTSSETVSNGNQGEPETVIVQTSRQNYGIQDDVPLSNVTQSSDVETTAPKSTSTENRDTFNVYSALISFALYLVSVLVIVGGCLYLNDCPADQRIPISYVVIGSLMLFSRILSIPEEYKNIFKNESNPRYSPEALWRIGLNAIAQIATVSVILASCFWSIKMNPDFIEGSPNYCEKNLYNSTYISSIVLLSALGILILLACCLCCIGCCWGLYKEYSK